MFTRDDSLPGSVVFTNEASGRDLNRNPRVGEEIITDTYRPTNFDVWGIDRARVNNGQATDLNSVGSGLFVTAEGDRLETVFTSVGSAPVVWTLTRVR
ncbi:hypothetical protein K1T35_46500 [Pseudonocardia sp. DSM 110487]|uniref:hypothetical protein n=1 Tax=Pseudonocardia sp. DSM 110487 TaxID=2865833 RepID=UPI001C69BFCE|nr:hypothetical protein [Pseudonocardia sp. DSM 110487]QYN35656.1 hypothetical protein K1T35_46500 [Pseudonocardia sp. DSM 110487]